MVHFKLRKQTENTIIKLIAIIFFIYMIIIVYLIFRTQNTISESTKNLKSTSATTQEINTLHITDTQSEQDPKSPTPDPSPKMTTHDTKKLFTDLKYKIPDISELYLGLPEFTHPATLPSTLECQKAFNEILAISDEQPTSEEVNLLSSIFAFARHSLAYKNLLDSCFGILDTISMAYLNNRDKIIKDRIMVLINKDIFGGLLTKMNNLNEFIYNSKNIKTYDDVELVYKAEIADYIRSINANIEVMAQNKNFLRDVNELSYGKDSIEIDPNKMELKDKYDSVNGTIVRFMDKASLFPSTILIQLFTNLFDIEIENEGKGLVKVVSRDVSENENLNRFINLYEEYMTEDAVNLVLILDKIRYFMEIENKVTVYERMIGIRKLWDDVQTFIYKIMKQIVKVEECLDLRS